MGEQLNQKPSALASSVGSLFQCIIFLVVIVALQIPMIYLAGSDPVHTDNPHPLDIVFDTDDHNLILQRMIKPSQRYIIVEGKKDSGVVSFMKYYANAQNNEKTVVIRQYTEDPLQAAYTVFRFAKTLVEDQLDLQQNNPRTWILFGFDKKVPHQDITQIKEKNIKDKIIVVTDERFKIKGFKHVIFPQITVEDLQKKIESELGTNAQVAQILCHHYQQVPEIFSNLNTANYSKQEHLGQFYQDLSELEENQESVVIRLCEDGKAKGQMSTEKLSEIGVVFHDGKFYWNNNKARLNYQLNTMSKCEHAVVPDQILTAMYQAQQAPATEQAQQVKAGSSSQQETEQDQQQAQQQTQQAQQESGEAEDDEGEQEEVEVEVEEQEQEQVEEQEQEEQAVSGQQQAQQEQQGQQAVQEQEQEEEEQEQQQAVEEQQQEQEQDEQAVEGEQQDDEQQQQQQAVSGEQAQEQQQAQEEYEEQVTQQEQVEEEQEQDQQEEQEDEQEEYEQQIIEEQIIEEQYYQEQATAQEQQQEQKPKKKNKKNKKHQQVQEEQEQEQQQEQQQIQEQQEQEQQKPKKKSKKDKKKDKKKKNKHK